MSARLWSFETVSELDVHGGSLTCLAVGVSCQPGAQLGLLSGTNVWSLLLARQLDFNRQGADPARPVSSYICHGHTVPSAILC